MLSYSRYLMFLYGSWARTELTRYSNPPRCRPYENQGTNEERAEEEALRDDWFRMLKSGLELNSDSGPE
jgi:hypothetical protein